MTTPLGQPCFKKDNLDKSNITTFTVVGGQQSTINPQQFIYHHQRGEIYLTKFESLPKRGGGMKGLTSESSCIIGGGKCQSVENLVNPSSSSIAPYMYPYVTSSTPPPELISHHNNCTGGGSTIIPSKICSTSAVSNITNGHQSFHKGLRRFLDKSISINNNNINSHGNNLKYSHSSHVLNPTSSSSSSSSTTQFDPNNGSSSTLSSTSNGSSSQSTGNLMASQSHSLEHNSYNNNTGHSLRDSGRSVNQLLDSHNHPNYQQQHQYPHQNHNFVKTPRSRSSSPHRSLRFKSSIARFIDSNGKIVDYNGRHGLPRKQLKTLLPMEDATINLTSYRQYSPIVDKNGLLSQVNSRTMDSLKENLDIYVLTKNANNVNNNNTIKSNTNNNSPKNVSSVKRRPSNLSCSRVLPTDERLYSPQLVKPFRSVSTLDSRRKGYQSYSGPTTPDREIITTFNGSDLQRKFSDPRIAFEHRDQYANQMYQQQQQQRVPTKSVNYQQYLQQQNEQSMKLIRNGARMLWCELPQVRELGLYRDLSPTQRQLQEALFEVITSEASYLRSLDILVNHFANNLTLSNPTFLDPRRKADLFSNIHVIRDISYNLMNILEIRWKQNIILSDVCDILVDYAYNHFAPYITYCRFKRRQESTLRELQLSSKFNQLIRQLESDPICQGLTLHSFLLLPVQRVTRYPLLVEAILRRLSPETIQYRSCKRTLIATDQLVKDCNTAANQYDKYLDLMSKLKFSSSSTIMKGLSLNEPRWLINNYDITRLKPETQSTLLIGTFRAPHWSNSSNVLSILSDMVLLSKKKGEELTVYDYCFRDLVQMRKIGPDTKERNIFNCKLPDIYKNLVKLTFLHNNCGKRIEYCLNFTSISERDECLSILDPKTNFIRTEQFTEPLWLYQNGNNNWEDLNVSKHQQLSKYSSSSSSKIEPGYCSDQQNGCQNVEYSHEIFI
ncbi:rho guanine nucleotide exchange factor 5-like [Panonychus citri]|uniref:rho guanine nucleotide exchange factor 5-like n=1 Tax=Panonychus citri TaxID=50023 RepID=UPI002307E4C8|nr:rho guanine nucleotide exchange factor 5-like [Panonychus citri]XP_053209173.1 rho guanine nucleotide exchange factor 5-like [Panonychus citri]